MAIPKEPRQLMINMMYIVLTALLALNISAEVLNAFKLVSDGMETSNKAIDEKKNNILDAFEQELARNKKTETEKLYADAQKVETLVNEFNSYLEGLRLEIIDKTGGYKDEDSVKAELKGKKDYDIPTTLMINQKKGDTLRDRIQDLRADLMAIESLTPEDKVILEKSLTLNTKFDTSAAKELGKKTWAQFNFDHVPTIAVNTILVKIKGDAKSSGAMVMEQLVNKIGKTSYKFDALSALTMMKSPYVLSGQKFESQIFVSAYSKESGAEVYTGQLKPGTPTEGKVSENPLVPGTEKLLEQKDGKGVYEVTTGAIGNKTVTGAIKVRKPNSDEFEYYPFKMEYQVAEKAVVVSPEKMNVFYIGVDNPVSVSVPGYAAERISASINEGGKITSKGGGQYNVRVTKVGDCQVSVSVKGDDGKVIPMGTRPFRMKRVPDPVPKVGNLTAGQVRASTFRVQRGVIADLENFDFDVKFQVLSFEMVYSAPRQDLVQMRGNGPGFTSQMTSVIQRAKPGDAIYFDNIRVKSPDGTTRKLPSIVYKLI